MNDHPFNDENVNSMQKWIGNNNNIAKEKMDRVKEKIIERSITGLKEGKNTSEVANGLSKIMNFMDQLGLE